MYKSPCIINSTMQRSFEDNAGICQLTEVLKICYHIHFCRSCFSTMVSFIYVLVFLNFFCFCFLSNKYYVMLLNFKRYFFSVITFSIDERGIPWNLDTKVKVFYKRISCFMKCAWNCISWNTSLMLISQCILTLNSN